jgi:BirA family biotin operon repressor/biotin-[acetyl-CoA-carboxylase] ligase
MAKAATDRRIDKLIELLVRNAMVVVPGPKIAAHIGVTRATVWTWVEKLRELGVEIKGHPATGYQLQSLPDLLVPSLIPADLGEGTVGHRIAHYFRTESTNSDAMELAAEGAPHGTAVIAEEQTGGRGRFGRPWHSEKSTGIYLSVILRPGLPPAVAPVITLMAGVATQAAVRNATGLATDIRWPNDLLFNGKKLCGILTEMKAEVDRIHVVVLGIGLNVNQTDFPDELKAIATSLRKEGGKPYPRTKVLAELLKELERYYGMLLQQGSNAIVERWVASSSYARDKQVRVRTGAGEYFATTVGVDSSGALLVRGDDGEQERLVAGEILEVKPSE